MQVLYGTFGNDRQNVSTTLVGYILFRAESLKSIYIVYAMNILFSEKIREALLSLHKRWLLLISDC